jgi:drug/metabolite transporter (DMT)-like permease
MANKPILWMVLGSAAFASMGAATHLLGSWCDWQVIILARVVLQLAFAIALACLGGVSLLLWKPSMLWIRSIGGSISMVLMFYAYTRLPVADVLTLANMFPIWVALFSWPLLGQPLSLSVWIAVASSLSGVVLMQQPQLTEGNFASLAALASSLFTGIAMIALNRLRGIDARAIIVHFSAVALIFCIVSLFLFERVFDVQNHLDAKTLLLLLGVGVLALAGQLFLTKAFTVGNAAKVSVVNLTQIVFAMIFDLLLFDHPFSPVSLIGMALVIVPTAWLMIERAEGGAERDHEAGINPDRQSRDVMHQVESPVGR